MAEKRELRAARKRELCMMGKHESHIKGKCELRVAVKRDLPKAQLSKLDVVLLLLGKCNLAEVQVLWYAY